VGILGHAEKNDFSLVMVKPDRGYVAVATISMSIATVSVRWLCRQLRQVGEGSWGAAADTSRLWPG
jgi:hypothetical protein